MGKELRGVQQIMIKLYKLKDLNDYQLQARDGEIGKLKEVYFDDQNWTVRYFVVHTGSWLLGQDVLIVPSVVTAINEEKKLLEVDLSQDQIRHCPPIDQHKTVSRHYEQQLYRYYDWQPYWIGDPLAGAAPVIPPIPIDVEEGTKKPKNPHLRSSEEVTGYELDAIEGDIGHIEDMILQFPSCDLSYLEINTGNWLSGKSILISPAWIEEINWETEEVSINIKRELIQSAPEYDAAKAITRGDELALFKHYGKSVD